MCTVRAGHSSFVEVRKLLLARSLLSPCVTQEPELELSDLCANASVPRAISTTLFSLL